MENQHKTNLTNKQLIRELQRQDSISSEQCKDLYNHYSITSPSSLNLTELTNFLIDLLKSNSLPPIVSLEALFSVLGEFALDIEQKSSVSFDEFHNFFVYSHPQPFNFILDVLSNSYEVPLSQMHTQTILLSFFVSQLWLERQNGSQNTSKMDINDLESKLSYELAMREIDALQIIPFFNESRRRFDAVLMVPKEDRTRILEIIASNPIHLNDHLLSAKKYSYEVLPRPNRIESPLVSATAKGLLMADQMVRGVGSFFGDITSSDKAQQLQRSVKKIAADVDQKTNISEIGKSFMDSTKELGHQASVEAKKIDTDLHISESLDKTKNDISSSLKNTMDRPSVHGGMNYLERLWDNASQTVSQIMQDSLDLVGANVQKIQNPNDSNGTEFQKENRISEEEKLIDKEDDLTEISMTAIQHNNRRA